MFIVLSVKIFDEMRWRLPQFDDDDEEEADHHQFCRHEHEQPTLPLPHPSATESPSSSSRNKALLLYVDYTYVPRDHIQRTLWVHMREAGTMLGKNVDGLDIPGHHSTWVRFLHPLDFHVVVLPGHLKKVDLMDLFDDHVANSHDDSVLVIVLCGHGSSGQLVLTNGAKVSLEDVSHATMHHRGTVLPFMLFCGARPSDGLNPLRGINNNNQLRRCMFIFATDDAVLDSQTLNAFVKAIGSIMDTRYIQCCYSGIEDAIRGHMRVFNGSSLHLVGANNEMRGYLFQPAFVMHRECIRHA